MFHAKKALCAAGLCVAFLSPAHAVIEIQCRYSQTGAVRDRALDLADQFHKSQSDYKVIAAYKGGHDEAMAAAIAAFRAGNAPDILQVSEVGAADMMHAKDTVVPVADPMTKADESFVPSGYVPAAAGCDTSARGESANENRGAARLFRFLSQHEAQAKCHQDTNDLPTTRVAHEPASQSGCHHNPGTDIAVRQMIIKTTDKSRGIRLGNFVQMRGIIDKELANAWSGKKAAKEALDAAAKRGDEQLVRFEKANR